MMLWNSLILAYLIVGAIISAIFMVQGQKKLHNEMEGLIRRATFMGLIIIVMIAWPVLVYHTYIDRD